MRVALVRADGRVAAVIVVEHAPRTVKAPPGHTKVELAEGQYCVVNARYNGVSFTPPGPHDDAPDVSLDAQLALLEARVTELEARPGGGQGGGQGGGNAPQGQGQGNK